MCVLRKIIKEVWCGPIDYFTLRAHLACGHGCVVMCGRSTGCVACCVRRTSGFAHLHKCSKSPHSGGRFMRWLWTRAGRVSHGASDYTWMFIYKRVRTSVCAILLWSRQHCGFLPSLPDSSGVPSHPDWFSYRSKDYPPLYPVTLSVHSVSLMFEPLR